MPQTTAHDVTDGVSLVDFYQFPASAAASFILLSLHACLGDVSICCVACRARRSHGAKNPFVDNADPEHVCVALV